MNILITGASGRIGSALADGLQGRHDLRLTDRVIAANAPDHSCVIADLATDDLAGLCDGIDAIVHLAGHPNSRDWAIVDEANVLASRRLAEAAVRAGVSRFLYASSIHVCGLLPADVPFSEDLPYAPDSPYGVSKAMVEMLLRYAAERHGLSTVAWRICSFRPEPGNARELRTWLSPADMVRCAEAALTADLPGFSTLWGLSNNSRAPIDRSGWDRIGYTPQDDAQAHADRLHSAGFDVSLVSEWPLLGGAVADAAGF